MSQFAVKWSRVISENESKLLVYLSSILRCPYLAEDALQDTYIRLAGMSTSQNEAIKNATSFCYQVARNIAIDMLRKFNRENLVDIEASHFEQLTDHQIDVESKFESEQLSGKINDTIGKLSRRHQNILSFYRHGRLKQKEIANLYKISPTLVNFMIKEAISSCQTELVSH
ncbi:MULTISPECIES: RNA polymerase sigma factor [Pseudoalteromonas]|uniref:RNA polymerase sigma-70 factor, ECF subfamily n=1 Tax=Pseudoalteromonas piscicida TaxID=43662 RepID=A0ABN5CG14_PSEO7|nr:sigma-70 family RNA polymerase sigma factor [Pseudoalteromonas piscicida]ATD08514.1 RNA polymerase sigma-70 factor, ECF subfamily [Pseudoalteromonas piscicida]WPU30543.1 sigma-70 family RNA polymerase sigma factor [Pseudoalteromonas piscicida]